MRSDIYEGTDRPGRRYFSRRLGILALFISGVFSVLVLRLYYLQVVKGPSFRVLSEGNRVSTVRVPAPRGNIYDRYGNVLATNRPSFSADLVLENVQDLPGTAATLSRVLQVGEEEVLQSMQRVQAHRSFEAVRIAEDISLGQVALLEATRYEWPGVQISVEPRRNYPHGKLAAHLLGHVGQVSEAELRGDQGYRRGEYVGKKGVERKEDKTLKGRDGFLQVEVDSLGREIRLLSEKEPLPGNDVQLTLDLGLQQVAEEALRGKAGAVVVLDVSNGDILAAASSPSVDSNRFVKGLSTGEWESVEKDELYPLQNRILRSQYPPGSVFKIATAIAALEKGVIDEETAFHCSGSLHFGERRYRCWKKGGHGKVSLYRALVESCDVYFYQVGIKTGIDNIAQYAGELGLGKMTGIDLGAESSGLVPSREWKKKSRGEQWFPGETLSAAIGQGYNLATPLQMAVLASILANNGTAYPPRLLGSVTDPDGNRVDVSRTVRGRKVRIHPANLALIRKALRGVVNDTHGTGRRAFVKGVDVGGKTGTAQVVRLPRGEERDKEEIPLRFRDHAWFICYVPEGSGGIAMAVLVEHGGHGGSASAPLAKRLLLYLRNLGYFDAVAEKR